MCWTVSFQLYFLILFWAITFNNIIYAFWYVSLQNRTCWVESTRTHFVLWIAHHEIWVDENGIVLYWQLVKILIQNLFELCDRTDSESFPNTRQSMIADFASGWVRWIIRYVAHSKPVFCIWPIVTSSRKPEVHNVLRHCRQKRTEPRPQVTCIEKFVKFERVVFEICERTDRHTHDRHADRNTSHLCRGRSNYTCMTIVLHDNFSSRWHQGCDIILAVGRVPSVSWKLMSSNFQAAYRNAYRQVVEDTTMLMNKSN